MLSLSRSDYDVDYGCDGFDGGTALHIACSNLSYESAKVLLEKGASVDQRNASNCLPIGEWDKLPLSDRLNERSSRCLIG